MRHEDAVGRRLSERLSLVPRRPASRADSAEGTAFYRVPPTTRHDLDPAAARQRRHDAAPRLRWSDCRTILILETSPAGSSSRSSSRSRRRWRRSACWRRVAHEVNTPLTGISSFTRCCCRMPSPTIRAPRCSRRSSARPSVRPRSSTGCSTWRVRRRWTPARSICTP